MCRKPLDGFYISSRRSYDLYTIRKTFSTSLVPLCCLTCDCHYVWVCVLPAIPTRLFGCRYIVRCSQRFQTAVYGYRTVMGCLWAIWGWGWPLCERQPEREEVQYGCCMRDTCTCLKGKLDTCTGVTSLLNINMLTHQANMVNMVHKTNLLHVSRCACADYSSMTLTLPTWMHALCPLRYVPEDSLGIHDQYHSNAN